MSFAIIRNVTLTITLSMALVRGAEANVLSPKVSTLELVAVRINASEYPLGSPPIQIGRLASGAAAHGPTSPAQCRRSLSMRAVLHNSGPSLTAAHPAPLLAYAFNPSGVRGFRELLAPIPNSADRTVDFGELELAGGTYTLQFSFDRTQAAPSIPEGIAASFVVAVAC
jgi:hypothetical protein